jgi:beta-glucosidase
MRVRLAGAAIVAAAGVVALGAPAPAGAQAQPVYRDAAYTAEERAADLVSRMTLEEKAAQLSTTNAPAIPRLGVAAYAYWSEAQHGLSAFYGGYRDDPSAFTTPRATSFPTNLAASLTWDPALIRRETSAISDEARGALDKSLFGEDENNIGASAGDYGNLVYWAPTVNLQRDPRWGRTDEAFGEDPFLVGTLGAAWVQGFQGEDARGRPQDRYLKAIATGKHYALNNVEHDRMAISSDTDEGTIRDYYTAQFRRLVEDAHVSGVMSSYNAINGTPAVADNLTLNVLLRKTFGFDGYVTSDCGAVGTTYRRPDGPGTQLAKANGVLNIAGHDWAPPGWATDHLDLLAHWTDARSGKTISAQSGATAFALRAGTTLNCVGASSTGDAGIWEGIRKFMGEENRADYVKEAIAAGILSEDVIDRGLVRVFALRMRVGEFDPPAQQRYTKLTRDEIESPAHRALAQQVAEEALTLLQNRRAGGPEPLLPADPAKLHKLVVVGDQADKVFLGGYSGAPRERVSLLQGLRQALPSTQIVYDAGNSSSTSTDAPSLKPETQAAIRDADLVVVMVGTDAATNAEGTDRASLAMPGNYGPLIDQVADLGNRRVALVVQSAGPVDLTAARDRVASILYSAANGQRQGIAAAAALVGRVNPSGHLSFTWYRDAAQLPPIADYDLAPGRTGGLGRTYQYFTGTPAYPFGHGLSYTRFRYDHVKISRRRIRAGGTERISLRVKNTGTRPGATVAQVYATPPRAPGVDLPQRKLVGFKRTKVLAPGRSQRLAIAVPLVPSLRAWNVGLRRQVVRRGVWRFAVARSAARPVRTFRVRIRGQIPRRVRTVTLAPVQLSLARGQSIELRGRNPWSQGLPPVGLAEAGDGIVSAVRADDSFVDLSRTRMTFTSNRPAVATVDRAGRLTAVGPGVATISVTIGGATGSAPVVVR